MAHSRPIQSQVKLPASVAIEVVMQGIRIRMGRSIVTMMGVVLGVAFLMSVLSTNVIRQSMEEESEMRRDMDRMLSFLEAESGPTRGRVFSILAIGDLNATEERLISEMHRREAAELRFYRANENVGASPSYERIRIMDDPALLGENSSGLVVMGDGDLPSLEWNQVTAEMRQKVLAYSRESHAIPEITGMTYVRLARQMRPEEKERMEMQDRQDRARNIWIITIALLVTVIGITNSLLMSVTERFKEIGTMKCLGALSSFIRRIFFIESALTGLVGSLIGGVLGFLVASLIYAFTFGFGLVFLSVGYGDIFLYYILSVIGGISMSIIAAIYPASFASRMVPATALRTNI